LQTGEVYEAEEVLDVVFPSGDEAAEVVHPGKQPLDLPSSPIAVQLTPILCLAAVASVGRNHLDVVCFREPLVEFVGVVSFVSDVPDCYYPLSSGLQAPIGYGRRVEWIEGQRGAFGFFEIPGSFEESSDRSEHEQFFYICSGEVEGEVAGERKQLTTGDIVEIPRGAAYRLSVRAGAPARFVAVKATSYLEKQLNAPASK